MGEDKIPGRPDNGRPPSGSQQIAAIFAALAAVAAAIDPLISLIDGDRVALNTGMCLVITVADVGAGIAILTVQRSSRYRKWWRAREVSLILYR